MFTHELQKYIGQSSGRVDFGASMMSQLRNRSLGTYRSGFTSSRPGASGTMVASICIACGSLTSIQWIV